MRVDHVCVVGSRLCRRFPLLHPRGIPRIVAQTKHCPGGPARGRFYPPLVWALDVFTRWPMMFRRQRPESADFARSSPEKMGRSRRRCDDRGRTRRRSRCRTSCTARGGGLQRIPLAFAPLKTFFLIASGPHVSTMSNPSVREASGAMPITNSWWPALPPSVAMRAAPRASMRSRNVSSPFCAPRTRSRSRRPQVPIGFGHHDHARDPHAACARLASALESTECPSRTEGAERSRA